ncbi:MAG TPA: pacearchaeosortase [Candidatus Nanoarchaeia archaeon]|nr:pacearchaeosortase [Candidatus Nanoarchaeia archaeon]
MNRSILFIFCRYLFLILIALPHLELMYVLATPPTLLTVKLLLSLFYGATAAGTQFNLNGTIIEMVPACIAGAAYYLLLVLNLSIPLQTPQRAKLLIYTMGGFFLFNIARIVLFAGLLTSYFTLFDLAHKLVWYGGSTLFVILLWFFSLKKLHIKEIPFYTDIKTIRKAIKKN